MNDSTPRTQFRRILGINFFSGTATEAATLLQPGGLLVVPAAPALRNLSWDADYREALLSADVAITDSSLMVMVWNFLERDSLRRLSGLEYLRVLLKDAVGLNPREAFWVMASAASAAQNIGWLRSQGMEVGENDYYVAPLYRRPIKSGFPTGPIVITWGGSSDV